MLRTLLLLIALTVPAAHARTLSPAGHFEFHSDPWINLHHFLYHWAVESAAEKPRRRTVPLGLENLDVHLDEQQAAWDQAVAAYGGIIDQDLLFNRELNAIKATLVEGPDQFPADHPVFDALRLAMPVYQTHFWARHHGNNQTRIDALMVLLESHEAALARRVAQDWESHWPEAPIRVDFSNVTNWAGAYTTNRPNHVMIASVDDRHQGVAVLEILFHEVGHTRPLGQAIRPAAEAALAAVGQEDSFLWHWVIFYTTGQAMVERFPDYVPYGERQGLWDRGATDTLAAFRTHWPAHVRGEHTLTETLEAIASE